MPLLKSIFRAPQPTPPPMTDTADLAKLSTDELQSALSDVARQRHVVVVEHAARVQPLLDQREKLMADVGKLDAEISWQGIQRTDAERVLDRQVLALQAELHARVVVQRGADVEDAHEVPDERQVEKLLEQMLSGQVERNLLIASTPSAEEACRRFDGLEAEAVEWLRHVARTRAVTGHTPAKPASVERFNHEVLADIAQRQRVSLT